MSCGFQLCCPEVLPGFLLLQIQGCSFTMKVEGLCSSSLVDVKGTSAPVGM